MDGLFSSKRIVVVRFWVALLGVVVLAACAKAPEDEEVQGEVDIATGVTIVTNLIDRAVWDEDKERLTVSGTAQRGDSKVNLTDGVSTQVLFGTAFVDGDRDWRFRKNFSLTAEVPCSVKAETSSVEQTISVRNAPVDCSLSYGNQTNNSPSNQAPNGTIGSPSNNRSINVGDSLFFSGVGTDPDGNELTYHWDFSNSGISDNNTQSPGSRQFNQAGTFLVQLTVSDSLGLSDPTPDSVTITVSENTTNSGNNPPSGTIVSPSTNSTYTVGSTVSFSATAVDQDGDTNLRYIWDFGGYAPRKSGRQVSLKLEELGVLNVKLLVRDSTSLWDPTPATTFITIAEQTTNANRPPNGDINSPTGNQTINVGDSVSFSATGSDPDGDAISYQWSFDDSGIQQSNLRVPGSTQFNRAGVFVVTLLATDINGDPDPTPATVTVTVNNSNTAPDSTIVSPNSNQVISAGDSILFRGSGFDAEGDNLTYSWNFDGVAPNSTQQNPGSIQFDNPGVYQVRLTVSDSPGLADPSPATVSVTVQSIVSNNQEPQSVITLPANNVSIQRGQFVNFNGTGSDPDNHTPLTYAWDFAGGAQNTSQRNPGNVQFNQTGFFAVSLTVTDANGLADSSPAIRYVQVVDSATNLAPVTSIINPPDDMSINVGDSILFSGTATDAENNTPLSYFWNFDGAALNSRAQNPGQVRFDIPGVYLVSLSATDSLGAADVTPAVRMITVSGNNTLSLPDSRIIQPAANRIISVGDSINFQGSGVDPNGNTPFTHLWNFAGVTPNSTLASPGNVRFDNAGVYEISYRVTNSLGISDPTPATVQVIVQNTLSVNEPPNGTILTPSTDLVIYAGDSLDFSGVGYDPNGDQLNYLWSFDNAVPDQYEQSPGVVQFNTPGVFNIMMAVSDSGGLTDPTPAIRTVTVVGISPDTAAPNAIIASPSSDISIFEGDTVNFVGLALDSDGDEIISYFWNFDGVIPNSTERSPGNVAFPLAGRYRVRFNVTDADGLSDPTPGEIMVTVQQANTPTGNLSPNGVIDSPASDTVITVGEAVYFSANAVDPDNNQPFTYRWNFDGAMPNTTAQNPGWVTFNRVGSYRVVLTVTDSFGQSDQTPVERFITVQGVQSSNQSPNGSIASPASNQVINVGDSVYFSGGGTDPEFNFPLTYYWDFDGASLNTIGAVPGTVMFQQEGVYDVQLRVVDSLGAIDPIPATVRIQVGSITSANSPPQSVINSPIGNQSISVGDSILFSGEGIDPEGGNVTYHWDFGASGIAHSNAQSPIVRFDNPGTFTVSLVVTDNLGLSDTTPATVTVTVDGNTTLSNTPNGIIVSPISGPVHINEGDSLLLRAQVSDPDGDPDLFVLWNFGTYPITNRVGESVRVDFDEVGVAIITLKVRDSTNLWDPTPATIEVHVQ